MIHDFRSGSSAKLVTRLTQKVIRESSCYSMPALLEISSSEITSVPGAPYVHRRGEDEYLMFAYLPAYHTAKYGRMPSFHVTQCETRQEFSGFVFANRMPVTITSKDEHTIYTDQHLEMCRNCRPKFTRNLFGSLGDRPWYEYVLAMAATCDQVKSDGYITMWKQTSEAVREKAGWICTNCQVHLPLPDKGFYLEVHHIDGNKRNNTESNLQALCVACHANVDESHRRNYSQGNNLLKLKEFRKLLGQRR